jgi:DNA polymerase-3 subunit gamma/tau
MSYQALARKWRPRTFADLVGQEHVVRALTNALEHDRLHHAYLLTGTRGVGKTTIARIFSKSLNCETGVTATPCGACRTCTEIDGGRYVDLLELDAASNTGIDNMREILDNARYAPTAGRYKVYLIDEVHMLSRAAFNSMLKTLEEPPEHVKFVLATTDPQKIPVTVLSRCLQFNLKPLPAPQIAARLARILDAEDVRYEAAALDLVATAAAGSVRDALSLLDQAIVHGAGAVEEAAVRSMLGAVDREYVWRLADAIAAADGIAMLAEVESMAERGLSFDGALQELAGLLHLVALAQVLPDALAAADRDDARTLELAGRLSPEAVQLDYQIALQGRGDLALAPDERTGFQMTLLRMLAFAPAGGEPARSEAPVRPTKATGAATAAGVSGAAGAAAPAPRAAAIPAAATPASHERQPARSAGAGDGATASEPSTAQSAESSRDRSTERPTERPTEPPPITDWPLFVAGLGLTGMAQQLAAQTELRGFDGPELVLGIPESARHLNEKTYQERVRTAVEQALGRRIRLRIEVTDAVAASLAEQDRRARERAQQSAESAFRNDPFVQELVAQFDARIRPDSIKPL